MICSNCGVEVEDTHDYCPLCLTPLGEPGAEEDDSVPDRAEPQVRSQVATHEPPRATRWRAGLWLIEAFTMVAGVAALVIFAADFAFSSEVGWSRFPLVSIALIWAVAVASVLLRSWPVLLSIAVFLLIALYTYAIDRFIGEPFWFVDVAVPTLAVLLLVVTGSVAIVHGKRLRLLQILSLLSFDVGIMLLVIEGSLQRHFLGEISVSWSVLGFACFAAVAVVIFYLHRSLRKRPRDVRRYLHL